MLFSDTPLLAPIDEETEEKRRSESADEDEVDQVLQISP